VPINHTLKRGRLEPQNEPTVRTAKSLIEKRRDPRFRIEVEIRIHSRTCGLLKGQTVDISKSGVSAILRIEVPEGEVVELDFTLPFGQVIIYATVRQRSAFRYGFQFLKASSANDAIQATCRELAVKQSLLGDV
jgi:PilZ domain